MATTLLTGARAFPGPVPRGRSGPSMDLIKEAPHTTPCPGCSGPVEAGDAYCSSCGGAIGVADKPVGEAGRAARGGFRCQGCGAEVRCEPGLRTTTCPFCAAPYVLELRAEATGRPDPEFVLGFGIDRDRAQTIYRQWLAARAWFRPGDLARSAQADGLKGIYLPFWSFSVRADSRWSAMVGEHWVRTETYADRDEKGNVVMKARQVTETEWWPLEGGHHAFYSFYLVSASRGLPQEVSAWVLPYRLEGLKRYKPDYLAGWLCEDEAIGRDAAYEQSQGEFHRREAAAIADSLPGDSHREVSVETEFSNTSSDLILLPLYLLSYRYRGRLFRTLINGQTGVIEGEKPVSPARIALRILALLATIALIAVAIRGISR